LNPASSRTLKFLDPEQAADFLGGLNSRTVTRWAREGYLPSYPIGEGKRRLWRFLESDLTQWMLSRKTGQFSIAAEV
jgi:excisionase family DNA binding protein